MNQQFKVRCFDAKTGTNPEILLMGENEAAVMALAQQAGLLVTGIEAVAPLAAVVLPSAAPMAAVVLPSAAPVKAPVLVAQVVNTPVVAYPVSPSVPAKPPTPKVPVAIPLAPVAASSPLVGVPGTRAPAPVSPQRAAVPATRAGDLNPPPPKRPKHQENLFPPSGEVVINVVPMLDMTFQLLFFFIITFQAPSGLEAQIPLALPPPEGQQEAAKDKKDQTDKDIVPTIDSDVIVEVKSLNNPQYPGEMGEVEVSGLAKEIIRPTPGKSLEDGRTEVLARLGEAMKQMAQDLKKDKLSLRLKADPGVKWERVIQVADTCRQAKFLGIRFEKPGGS